MTVLPVTGGPVTGGPAPEGGAVGRPGLVPPPMGTPLDRAWRRRCWRLERAHDDWGLHPGYGDPRAAIRQAAGLVRLYRRSVRDLIAARRRLAATGDLPAGLDLGIRDGYAAYRLAVAALAAAVAAFDARNSVVAGVAGVAGVAEAAGLTLRSDRNRR